MNVAIGSSGGLPFGWLDSARTYDCFGSSPVTDACNTCHQSAEVGMIVIQVPDSSAFPDQDFRPVKR